MHEILRGPIVRRSAFGVLAVGCFGVVRFTAVYSPGIYL
ncbi:hypothetical protein PAMC26577_30275 [Caballeronia sordidicola]|uniref:Uncharacterized protein n=1 Tax=Caballeronia sordidicola TaxID=196367 RepID=A0A242MDE9_CABSO|nr:hypothetical protein PAMC26577_30275 [Caballeronia sordidicola]